MKAKKFRSKKTAARVKNIATYAILIIISLVWLIPFLILILQSFNAKTGMSIKWSFTFDNYVKLFTETEFPRWYGNTLLVSVVVTVIQTVIVLMTSYALSRLRFKLRKPLMNLMLILGMFPGFLSMVAVYYLLKEVGLANVAGLISVYSASSARQYYIC